MTQYQILMPFVIECNIPVQGSFVHSDLKNLKKVECECMCTSNWSIICSSMGGYSLNRYGNYDVGIIYDKANGKITFQYSSDANSINKITRIIGYR